MQVYEVHEVTGYLNALLRNDPVLSDVWVRGEVVDLSSSSAGHMFFSLRDDLGQLRCVLWRSLTREVLETPSPGMIVVAHGQVGFYEAGGRCQLYVDQIVPEGLGTYRLQYEMLKLKLEREGLFAPERKRSLPSFPSRIGVITSEAGAVIHDIVTVLQRRYPLAEVEFVPSSVQGERAPLELTNALQFLNRQPHPVDVIILARGGGSEEELAVFNDERLARAIYASRIPVVSAVGHERDFTIADLVADVRAPTPSAAAELVSPDLQQYRMEIAALRRRAVTGAQRSVDRRRELVSGILGRLKVVSPSAQLALQRRSVEDLRRRARSGVLGILTSIRQQLHGKLLQLRALDPRSTLARGYSICYSRWSGRLVTSAEQVEAGEALQITLWRGSVLALAEQSVLPQDGLDRLEVASEGMDRHAR